MAVGKKGMFYTLLTILFILVLLFFVRIKTETRLSEKIDLTKTRIETINQFVDGVEEDLRRALYISGYRTILAMNQHLLISNGIFIGNTEDTFREGIFNGTINNIEYDLIKTSSFKTWSASIQNKGSLLNINLELELMNGTDLLVYQEDPWHVVLEMNLTIIANDKNGLASWNTNSTIKSVIDLNGFEDPLYIVKTYGRYTNIINRTIYEGVYTYQDPITGIWDLSNLTDHVNKRFYAENTDAPSFLMRFEGNLNPSTYGIESMVNLEKLDSLGIPIYPYSVVDHEYWHPTNGNQVLGMQSWFRIDNNDDHRAKYQIDPSLIVL